MLLTKLFSFALLAATTQVSAQTLASTAGVPATQNVGDGGSSTAIPPGQNGLSTGTSVNFQSGSTAGAPSSSVVSSALTGDAASLASASLATQAAQGSGSNDMYTSTTGGNIAGISSGLPGGYNEPTPSSTGGAGTAADSTISQMNLDGVFVWMMATTAGLMGALVIL